jgi:glucuronoarabinoxylan endo-1,4-beta-xylanase
MTAKYFTRLSLLFPLLFVMNSSAATVEVDATQTCQTIDGFGASSAWIGGKITNNLAIQFWQDDTIDGHIGLSILRTRIDPRGYTSSEAAPMKQAIEIYPDIKIWSAAWTPPGNFKTNGSTVGGSLKSDAASQQGYADFLVKYVQDVKENMDIDLYAVSCQNEPDFNPSYEGCQWSGEQFQVFVRDYWGPACEEAGITAKRMISESYRNNLAISDPSLKDSAAAKYVDIIGGHLYGGGPNPYPLAESLNKQYWETENSGMGGPDESINNGIRFANIVHNCLVRCNMNAYHYWWLVNNNNDDEGLCNSSGRPTPRMYTIGNFSKFIRPGYVRVDATASPASNITSSAYLGATEGKLVIVAINNGNSSAGLDFTIEGFQGATKAVPWITDNTHSLEKLDPLSVEDDAFFYELPSKSVVSFVLANGGTSVKSTARDCTLRLCTMIVRNGGGLQVKAPSIKEPWTLRVLLPSGRQVFEKRVEAGCRSVSLKGTELGRSGVFIVRIQQASTEWTSRLILPP